jgi:hypothetical protein
MSGYSSEHLVRRHRLFPGTRTVLGFGESDEPRWVEGDGSRRRVEVTSRGEGSRRRVEEKGRSEGSRRRVEVKGRGEGSR